MLSLGFFTEIAYAKEQYCYKIGGGKKTYKTTNDLTTGWEGNLRAKKNNILKDDQLYFTGKSKSAWKPNKKNAKFDSIVHYDVTEVKGLGSPSFSGGVTSNSSGLGINFGASVTSGSKAQVYTTAYNKKHTQLTHDYSYYAEIYSCSWIDLYTGAKFQFGSHFTSIDARVNKGWTKTGTIWYS